MTLKKDLCTPGARVILKDTLKDGVPASLTSTVWGEKHDPRIEAVRVGGVDCGPGTELEIVKKPRRIDGRVNSVRVRIVNQPEIEGEVYWCELRASARHK